MTALAIITGTLHRTPEARTSKAGRPFAMATIRVKDGDGAQYWKIFAFSESAQAELMRLREGDALSAQGTMKAELYRPEGGEPRLSLSLTADQVLALRPEKRKPKRAAPTESPRCPKAAPDATHLDRYGGDGADHFGDENPF